MAYVTPLALMLAGGGRSLEDLRTLKADTALATLLKQGVLPGTDASGDWLRRTGAVAETLHSMNDTKKAFRLIAVKYKQQGELFDDAPRHHVIASNRAESTEPDWLSWTDASVTS